MPRQISHTGASALFEFHGWAVVRSRFDIDDPRRRGDQRAIEKELEDQLRLFERPENFWLHRTVNGLVSVTCSGLRNHRREWATDLFRWLAQRAQGSYGLLYIHDDEDWQRGGDFQNVFRVWRLAKGELTELEDAFLSPYIPTVEEPYSSPKRRAPE